MTRGHYPICHPFKESLVEYGLARFIEKDKATVEEPLALISIVRYFERNHRTLSGNIWNRFKDDKGTAFEELTLLAITKLLQGGRPLGEVFEFHPSISPWAGRTAQVVARTSDGFENFTIVNDQLFPPSRGIAFYAEGPKDVKQWLESGEAGWCRPGPSMGPDLMVRLRLDDKEVILLVIQAKCYFSGNKETLTASVTAKAIRSLIPRNFFASMVRR